VQKPGLVMLDNSAKVFAVSEINRLAATRCVTLLQAICHDFGSTAVLIAHDNRNGDYSGSSAWQNACRSRLHLTRGEDSTTRLKMPKANYAATGGELALHWDDWSFRADDPAMMTPGERLQAEMEARGHGEIFLRALDELTAQKRNVSDSVRAGNYAPKVMLESNLAEGLNKRQLHAAMIRLLNEGRIRANEPIAQRANRAWLYGLARTAHP
jgi:RecA-family ATPase